MAMIHLGDTQSNQAPNPAPVNLTQLQILPDNYYTAWYTPLLNSPLFAVPAGIINGIIPKSVSSGWGLAGGMVMVSLVSAFYVVGGVILYSIVGSGKSRGGK